MKTCVSSKSVMNLIRNYFLSKPKNGLDENKSGILLNNNKYFLLIGDNKYINLFENGLKIQTFTTNDHDSMEDAKKQAKTIIKEIEALTKDSKSPA